MSHTNEAEDKKRPNILIIYPDQMRVDVMGCAGNPCIKTPNIDRLAMEGVRFENAFTSLSTRVCAIMIMLTTFLGMNTSSTSYDVVSLERTRVLRVNVLLKSIFRCVRCSASRCTTSRPK